jgi:hypothetical protein
MNSKKKSSGGPVSASPPKGAARARGGGKPAPPKAASSERPRQPESRPPSDASLRETNENYQGHNDDHHCVPSSFEGTGAFSRQALQRQAPPPWEQQPASRSPSPQAGLPQAAQPAVFSRRNIDRLGGGGVASLLGGGGVRAAGACRSLSDLVAQPTDDQRRHAAQQKERLRLDLEHQMRERKEAETQRKAALRALEEKEEQDLRRHYAQMETSAGAVPAGTWEDQPPPRRQRPPPTHAWEDECRSTKPLTEAQRPSHSPYQAAATELQLTLHSPASPQASQMLALPALLQEVQAEYSLLRSEVAHNTDNIGRLQRELALALAQRDAAVPQLAVTRETCQPRSFAGQLWREGGAAMALLPFSPLVSGIQQGHVEIGADDGDPEEALHASSQMLPWAAAAFPENARAAAGSKIEARPSRVGGVVAAAASPKAQSRPAVKVADTKTGMSWLK